MSNIEQILNNRDLSNEDKLYGVRQALGINPLPEDVKVGEAWLIKYEGNQYKAIKKNRQRWIFAYENDGYPVAPDHHEVYCRDVELIRPLTPDPGDFDQQVEEEIERRGRILKTKYEKQRVHTASLEVSLARRNERISELDNEVSRLRAVLDAKAGAPW